jgi:hypothetical protein
MELSRLHFLSGVPVSICSFRANLTKATKFKKVGRLAERRIFYIFSKTKNLRKVKISNKNGQPLYES